MENLKYFIPVRTPNPSNSSRGIAFMVRKQHREQHKRGKEFTTLHLDDQGFLSPKDFPKVKRVRLCRICPGNGLDGHDNLRSALKWVVDGIAEALATDDAKIKWDYTQRRGTPKEYGVEVEIQWRKQK